MAVERFDKADTRSALVINGLSLQPPEEADASEVTDGVELVFCSIDDLDFSIRPGRVCVRETISERDLAEFGLVHVAGYPRPTSTLLGALTDYLAFHEVPTINTTDISVPTKLRHYVQLAQANLPVPRTIYRSPRRLIGSYARLADEFELPFVLKAMSTNGSKLNYLISSEDDLVRHIHDDPVRAYRLLVQEFIPNDQTIQVLVFGEEAVIIMRWAGVDKLYLTDTALGGNATLLTADEIDPTVGRLAVQAASLVGYEIAGVNLIQDWITGKWFVLNINSNPTLATGAFAQQKLEAYSSYLKQKLAMSGRGGVSTTKNRKR